MVCLDNAKLIGNGTSSCFLIEQDRLLFYKTDGTDLVSMIRRWSDPLSLYLLSMIPFKRHVSAVRNRSKLIEKEVRTLQLWKDEGIEVPELIDYSDSAITYAFIDNSRSYKEELGQQNHGDAFELFLELYDRIRKAAKRHRNPDILHSDPHLDNFLCVYGQNGQKKAIPIDPELILNPRMSFEDIDTNLLVDTLVSISGLKTSEENRERYIRGFKQLMTEEDIGRITSLDYSVPPAAMHYFRLREEFAYRIKGREKRRPLAKITDFIEYYETRLKGILLE
ncbi:hypothetical protein COV19_06115 [Candidatus Woesearchaeota archaeon CG10_big_fil_rev_8_21_14_0_10_44_13]|nr:MAG: hypothetical protein COV19_06115 [Candidatus Woesearchaeota archaeon CG10_big_fil_rev_8_21_14_0_10_44_13]